jgi:aminoglycoside phosphotransferase (APT) family kinase protein
MSWLKPGLKWVYDNEPSERSSAVVHCDFHPNNILVDDGEISAVLDWTSGRIGEPEKDVASTRNVLRAFRPFFRPDVDWVSFTDDYLVSYLRRSRVALERVEYYEALHSLRVLELIEAGFTNDLPGVRDRLLARVREVTGLRLSK